MQSQGNKYIKERRRKKRIKNCMGLFTLFIGLFILFLLKSPTFNISEIVINNNSTIITEDLIKEKTEIFMGKNIFWIKRKDVQAVFEREPYIKEVVVSKKLPNKLTIEVVENKPVFMMESEGKVFVLDKYGKILDKKAGDVDFAVVRLEGINIKNREINSYITDDEKTKEIIGSFGELLAVNTSEIQFNVLDLKDSKDIKIYSGDVLVKIGSEYSLMTKLDKAIDILKNLKMAKGYIDVRFDSNPIIGEN
ncbi:MAG: FtsQ-type POTRA domain-containing protein [Clostridiaceae bacterium]